MCIAPGYAYGEQREHDEEESREKIRAATRGIEIEFVDELVAIDREHDVLDLVAGIARADVQGIHACILAIGPLRYGHLHDLVRRARSLGQEATFANALREPFEEGVRVHLEGESALRGFGEPPHGRHRTRVLIGRRMKLVRAYGDREGDGMVQMSFVLALPPSPRAREAAKKYAEKHGLGDPIVATMEEAAEGHTYFVVYGHSHHEIDMDALEVPELRTEPLAREEIEHRIHSRLGRKIVVVGACTGSDAHTVGIDAILNYKGYAGDKGLESYKGFEAYNLGAQVENEQLAMRARSLKADAILVSQIITQRDCHKENAHAFVELVKAQGWRSEVILLLGGPRIDHKLALELGFDAGFGPGTKPNEVASFLVEKLCSEPK